MVRRSVAAVALLLVAVAAGTATGSATVDAPTAPDASALAAGSEASALDASDPAGTIEYRLSLTPDRPGEIEVEMVATIPDSVRRLRVDLGERQTVTSATGFQADGDEWRWDGATDRPSLTYAVAVNRTNRHVEGIDAADVGPWALFSLGDVQVDYQYWYVGSEVSFGREYVVDGEGVTGSNLAYLGPYDRHERTAGGETFVLVVPASADLAEPPGTVLDTLAGASGQLSVGPRRNRVHAFAVPYQLRRGGLAVGGDFWVTRDSRVAHPDNAWIHEYVHTRQRFETTAETRWLTEASAEYYAALLTWRQGRIDYRQFADHLADDRHADAVLSRPDSWDGPIVPYRKGQRVMAALDVEIRAATDGRASVQDVLARLDGQEEPVTHTDLEDAVAAVADQRFDGWLDRYVRADGQPTLPDDPAAYGRPDDRPVLDADRLEFHVRGTWTADPRTVPAGVPVDVRYRGDERVDLLAGTNATFVDDGTVRLTGDTATVVVRSTVDPLVSVTVTVPTSDDVDGDGLSNAAELTRGTDPWSSDTDGDGLDDGPEVNVYGADPLVADTDGDGLADGEEVHESGTDPTREDTDGDGLPDGEEVHRYETDPTDPDTDGDGYADDREVGIGTDPTTPTSWWQFAVADLLSRLSGLFG